MCVCTKLLWFEFVAFLRVVVVGWMDGWGLGRLRTSIKQKYVLRAEKLIVSHIPPQPLLQLQMLLSIAAAVAVPPVDDGDSMRLQRFAAALLLLVEAFGEPMMLLLLLMLLFVWLLLLTPAANSFSMSVLLPFSAATSIDASNCCSTLLAGIEAVEMRLDCCCCCCSARHCIDAAEPMPAVVVSEDIVVVVAAIVILS